MRELKFSYMYRQGETGRIIEHKYTLDEMESGKIANIERHNGYVLVARRQFIGLTDKCDVEIYAGDVVRWTTLNNTTSTNENVDVIEWCNDVSCYLLMPGCHEPHYACMEVVGNIYQNPELLEMCR